jgi:hypothetical protein
MLWWDWRTKQRLALMAGMCGVAAIPWLIIGRASEDWRALVGGTAFLFIPQIVGWLLYVGLATGRMPSGYGHSELRDTSPRAFWLTGGLYAGLLLLSLYIILSVMIGGTIRGI